MALLGAVATNPIHELNLTDKGTPAVEPIRKARDLPQTARPPEEDGADTRSAIYPMSQEDIRMKRITLVSLLFASVGLSACMDDATAPAANDGETLLVAQAPLRSIAQRPETTGNHLVVFNNSVPVGFGATVEALGGEVVSTHDVVGAMLVTGLDDAGLAKLSQQQGVTQVEPEPMLYLPEIGGEPEVTAAEMDLIESPMNPAGAFFFPRQWHMRAIGADQAWRAGFLGSEDVTVAILDTGIDYGNLDLAGRVDLSRSISLRPEDDALVDAFFPGKHYITDLQYHGTHVAATAVSNGVVGAGVTSQTTLMGVKVCSVYGGCIRIFEAIEYAVANGADIINMSLGGPFRKRDYPGYVSIINRYITYMNSQGVLLVVSAGNDSFDLDHDRDGFKLYCDAPHAVCVSGTGPMSSAGTNGPWVDIDAPYYATNYGRSAINVAAPAGNYGGFVYAACSQTSLVIPVCRTGNYIIGIRGTSMAAPHVSGLAAMIMAEHGTGNPSATRAMLEATADDLGETGTDPYYGKGRINAATAMGVN